MKSKRHAAPTERQLLERIYRRQLELSQQIKSLAPLIPHCERLLREKESLVRRLALVQAANFIAKPLADVVAKPDDFSYFSPEDLKWATRSQSP